MATCPIRNGSGEGKTITVVLHSRERIGMHWKRRSSHAFDNVIHVLDICIYIYLCVCV